MACNGGHALLIVFAHACGYYLRAATISFTELHVWLLIGVRPRYFNKSHSAEDLAPMVFIYIVVVAESYSKYSTKDETAGLLHNYL